ncbi:hypothetical protein Salat_1738900 [Sesamum alatum]|uniref:Uncharacterized protein n=1 Tax=Sesamum alatum TaxID=300844 RepID=A0AAE2CKM8_9LAMI|nr:hypothetical protein Salat_1738900 [Sesamum alatum]
MLILVGLVEFCSRFNLCDRASVAVSVSASPSYLPAVVLSACWVFFSLRWLVFCPSLKLSHQSLVPLLVLSFAKVPVAGGWFSCCWPHRWRPAALSELFWVRFGSVFRRHCNLFPTEVQLLLASVFFYVPVGLAGRVFMVLGDQLLHLKRTSRFERLGFDFQKVFNLFGKPSICDIAPHFYHCLVELERFLLSCSPSPHWSLASSYAQLLF